MPRNSSGVYTQPAGTTGVALQPINPDAYNSLIADLGNEITGSVPRNGSAAMLEQLTLKSVDPVLDDHAARKKYVDDKAAAATPADGSVTTAKLAAQAATPAKISLGSLTDVASAATVNLGAQTSRNIRITGTTTITSLGTTDPADRIPFNVQFAAALTLTNGTNLILPGGANITTAAGDTCVVAYEGSSVWRVVSYTRAAMPPLIAGTAANNLVALDGAGKLPAVDGSQLTNLPSSLRRGTAVPTTSGTAVDFTGIPSTAKKISVVFSGVSTNGASGIIVQLGDASSIKNSGYVSGATYAFSGGNASISPTSGFALYYGAATETMYARLDIYNVDGNTWVAAGNGQVGPAVLFQCSGVVTLTDVLTRLRITTVNGADVFDAGKVNIFWE